MDRNVLFLLRIHTTQSSETLKYMFKHRCVCRQYFLDVLKLWDMSGPCCLQHGRLVQSADMSQHVTITAFHCLSSSTVGLLHYLSPPPTSCPAWRLPLTTVTHNYPQAMCDIRGQIV